MRQAQNKDIGGMGPCFRTVCYHVPFVQQKNNNGER